MNASRRSSQRGKTGALPLRVRPLAGRGDRERFLRLPWSVYADDPAWIPPLLLERRDHLSARNPYFQHAEFQAWLAFRGERPAGRISAQVDRLHLERYDDRTGFFGMIEGEDDPELFAALLAAAGSWLRERGMVRMRGPFNLSINEECGLLVEGFDRPPVIMMGHARPYYGPRLEEQGMSKVQDLLAYTIRTDFPAPSFLPALVGRVAGGVTLRQLRKDRFEDDLRILQDIFEDAWSANWGFIPFTAEEFSALGKSLRLLVPPEFVRIAELDGEPVAMMVVFPNVNEAIRDLDGRLLPSGWLRLLWRLKVRGVRSGRVPLMGVRRRFQGGRLGAALALMLITSLQASVRARGMEEAEMSWILEENLGMRHIIETIGGTAYKRYRLYEKELRAT